MCNTGISPFSLFNAFIHTKTHLRLQKYYLKPIVAVVFAFALEKPTLRQASLYRAFLRLKFSVAHSNGKKYWSKQERQITFPHRSHLLSLALI